MKRNACVVAILMSVMLRAASVHAEDVSLNVVTIATGVDVGPQDGVFDEFATFSLGSVNNNGWTSFRTAFEFDLSRFQPGSTINSALLTMALTNFEGTRAVEVHSYAGDGTVQLSDFALNGLAGTVSLGPTGTQTLNFDVTAIVADLVANGATIAGFNLREEPANNTNFLVMFLEGLPFLPVLSIEVSTEQIVDIDIKPGSMPNSINRQSRGKVPVAILSSPTFNAPVEVDATSLTFGRTGTETSFAFCSGPEDLNGDGLLDMACHFNTESTGFLLGDTQGVLEGRTLLGGAIKGADSVRIVL